MCRRVGEPSRASRARAAVGSPPGQCRQSNYPSASFSPFSHCLSLSTFLSVSLALALSRCLRSHRVSPSLLFPLSLSFSLRLFLLSILSYSLLFLFVLAYDSTRFSHGFLSRPSYLALSASTRWATLFYSTARSEEPPSSF